MHVLGARDHTGAFLESPVGRKTHPEGLKIIGRGFPGFGVPMVLWLVHAINSSLKFQTKLAELCRQRKQPDLTIAPSQIWGEYFKKPDVGEGNVKISFNLYFCRFVNFNLRCLRG
jgi:hypothetical protein